MDVLKSVPAVPNTIEAKTILNQAYEQTFGVFDHLGQNNLETIDANPDSKRPMIEVAFHPSEDICARSQLYKTIKEFKDRKVYQYFGLSLLEFLDLPVDICDYILDVSGKQTTAENTKQGHLLNELNQSMDGFNK